MYIGVDVRASERLGEEVDKACFAAGMVGREGFFQGGEVTWVRIWQKLKVGWPTVADFFSLLNCGCGNVGGSWSSGHG